MRTLKPDSRRRITMPKGTVKEDEEYVAYRMPDGKVVLHPVSKEDPIEVLGRLGERLGDKSIRQIREEAEEAATREALDDLRGH